jgi:hypothetical protein
MSASIPGWTPEIERSFKEILFRFLEEIQCTKAALYLLGPDGSHLLATQYGFGRRDLISAEHRSHDPMAVKVGDLGGDPRAFNQSDNLESLSDYLRDGGTTRLLVAPLIHGNHLVGFVDARDKGRKRPFEPSDEASAKAIAGSLVELAARSGLLASHEAEGAAPTLTPVSLPAASATSLQTPMLDELGLEEVHDAALDCVLEHQVLTVAVTLATPGSTVTLVSAREGGAEVDRAALLNHQRSALAEVGIAEPPTSLWQVEVRRVPTAAEAVAAPLIASAVLLNDPVIGSLTASVIAGGGPETARTALERFRVRVQDAREKSVLRFTRRSLARRLLQPGERAYPDLVAHSEAVSRLSWSMAVALDLGPMRAEEAALAGLLHDVGMRELDYERLYRSPSPSAEDRVRYQEHPEKGERIVRGTGLEEVAAAVRNHHERWDGNGYPDRLARESIPLLARLVHVAEVFDVLSVPGRYRPTVSQERALEIITRTSGHQFDPQMVEALCKVVQ